MYGMAWMGAKGGLTFRLDTRSAVSRRVNWLIWSTMPAILGLTGAAAASVELCRRDTLWRRDELEARTVVLARSWRAQHRAAYLHDIDMAEVVMARPVCKTERFGGRCGRDEWTLSRVAGFDSDSEL